MKILVTGAEASFHQEMRALIEGAEGITAIQQQAGPQIVDQIQELQPDLILLDLDAGTSYPPDVVSTISKRYPNIKIVVLSSPGQEGKVLNALRHGAHGHLTKGNSDGDQLIAALRAVGRGDSILSPSMAGVILDEMSYRYQILRRTGTAAGPQASSPGSTSALQVTE